MKEIFEHKKYDYDTKVIIEMSLAEIAAIHAVFAETDGRNLTKLIEERKLPSPYLVGLNDQMYRHSKGILEKYNMFK